MKKTPHDYKSDSLRVFDDGLAQEKVVKALDKRGYKLQDIARAVGLSVSEVRKLLNGT